MKIEPSKFEQMLRILSLYEGGKGYIDPIEIDFTEEGIKVAQADPSYTAVVIAKYPPTIFKDYNAVGTKKFNTDLVKELAKFFKMDETITLEFTEEKLLIKGKMEKLEDGYPSTETNRLQSNITLKDWGFTTDKIEPTRGYKVDIGYLKDIDGEIVTFEYGDNLKVIVEHDLRKYTRQVSISTSFGDSEGKQSIAGNLFKRVVNNLDGQIWIVFSQEPIIFSWGRENAVVTYITAPVVV